MTPTVVFLFLIIVQVVKSENFSCIGRAAGYYADLQSGCQQYHVCSGGKRQYTYSCPNTTLFQQRMMICDHEYLVDCSQSEKHYSANLLIGQQGVPFVSAAEFLTKQNTTRPFYKYSSSKKTADPAIKPTTFKPFVFPTGRATSFQWQKHFPTTSVAAPKPTPRPATSTTPFKHTFQYTTIPQKNIMPSTLFRTTTARPTVPPIRRISESTIQPAPVSEMTPQEPMPTPFLSSLAPTNQNLAPSVIYTAADLTNPPSVFFDENSLEARSLRGPSLRLEWTLPDTRAMLFIPDSPEEAVAPNIKRYSVTIPQPRMVFKSTEKPTGSCPNHCHPAFMVPGSCHPCVMIK